MTLAPENRTLGISGLIPLGFSNSLGFLESKGTTGYFP
jgi:hypothetical protein